MAYGAGAWCGIKYLAVCLFSGWGLPGAWILLVFFCCFTRFIYTMMGVWGMNAWGVALFAGVFVVARYLLLFFRA